MRYFELVTEAQALQRRVWPLNDPTLAKASTANALLEGEFLFLNDSYKLVRATANDKGFALFMEKGRYDVQAVSGSRTTVLAGGTYEADTLIFTAAALTMGGDLAIDAAVNIGDGVVRSGLKNWTTGVVIGFVTRLPANNGNKLRFFQTLV